MCKFRHPVLLAGDSIRFQIEQIVQKMAETADPQDGNNGQQKQRPGMDRRQTGDQHDQIQHHKQITRFRAPPVPEPGGCVQRCANRSQFVIRYWLSVISYWLFVIRVVTLGYTIYLS